MTEKSDSPIEDAFNRYDFGRRETNDETHKIIEQILDERFKEFGFE